MNSVVLESLETEHDIEKLRECLRENWWVCKPSADSDDVACFPDPYLVKVEDSLLEGLIALIRHLPKEQRSLRELRRIFRLPREKPDRMFDEKCPGDPEYGIFWNAPRTVADHIQRNLWVRMCEIQEIRIENPAEHKERAESWD